VGNVASATRQQPALSPDGRGIAYQSTETGENEIFVQPFPEGGSKYMVPSEQNNHHPVWSADGRELYYIPRMGVSYAIGVRTTPRVAFGAPTPINRGGRSEGPPAAHRNHDIAPDGRFIGIVPGGTTPLSLVFPPKC
jgi:eukaryotic-like serine/threonine-protein kinase